MIHHVSIPARDPQHVAEVLGGTCFPFGPLSLKNARSELMADPQAVRLMRATHIKEPA